MQFHPYAELFPQFSDHDAKELQSDILANGIHEPVWIYNGKILDGRNRWNACNELFIECPTREYIGNDPLAFVLSLNMHRRHLTESQRGMVAAKLSELKLGANLRPTHAQAATMLNVSERTVDSASKVIHNSPKEVVHAVESGKVSVSLACKVADMPKKEQKKIVSGTKKEIIAAVAKQKEEEIPEEYQGDFGPSDEELENAISEESRIFDEYKMCMEHEYPLAQALKEVVRYKEAARVATERFNGLQNECNELIRLVKARDRKIAKLEQGIRE